MKLFEKMEKSEVGGKEVKRRKRSAEMGSGVETAKSGDSQPLTQLADLPSPAVAEEPLEIGAGDTAEIKQEITESATVSVVDTNVTESSHDAVVTAISDNIQSDVTGNTATSDLPCSDAEIQSLSGVSDACLSPAKSPAKPVVMDGKPPEEFQRMELESNSRDGVGISTDVKDVVTSETIDTGKRRVKTPRKVSPVKKSKQSGDTLVGDTNGALTETTIPGTIQTDIKVKDVLKVEKAEDVVTSETVDTGKRRVKTPRKVSPVKKSKQSGDTLVGDTSGALTETTIPGTIQTDIKVKDVLKVEKADSVISVAKFRAIDGSPKRLATAKLKFGMYSRKPLASRSWVSVDKVDAESSSDIDDQFGDVVDKSTSESEILTTKARRGRPVNFFSDILIQSVTVLTCCSASSSVVVKRVSFIA